MWQPHPKLCGSPTPPLSLASYERREAGHTHPPSRPRMPQAAAGRRRHPYVAAPSRDCGRWQRAARRYRWQADYRPSQDSFQVPVLTDSAITGQSANDTVDGSEQTLQPTGVLPDHLHRRHQCFDRCPKPQHRLRRQCAATGRLGTSLCPPSSFHREVDSSRRHQH